jgi:flagellar basal body-associated protein FliL
MDWIVFFGNLFKPSNIVIFIIILIIMGSIAISIILMRRNLKGSNLPWKCFLPVPYISRGWKKQAVLIQNELAETSKDYTPEVRSTEEDGKAFKAFIRDLPIYCITDNVFSRLVRGALVSGGAQFQQVVLHDKSSIDDTYLHIRKQGDRFMYNGGVYLFPWDLQKSVLHWDIDDCRPMEEKSPQAQWASPKMNSRYFWGILNSVAMNNGEKEFDKKLSLMLIMLGIIIVAIIGLAYMTYQTNSHMSDMVNTLQALNDTVSRNSKTVLSPGR